jgi:membrane protein DedA with SNARE-associated domain
MLHWITHLVNSLSYWGVAILMAVENIVLPIPSELIMPLAGFRTDHGQMTLFGVILAGTAGSVLGALPLYYAGYALGEDRASNRFSGNSLRDVTLGQLLPGIRGLISIPAGIARMNVGLFLLANLIGTVVWCTVLAVAGKLLGRNFTRIHKFLGPTGWVILGLLVAGLAYWLIRRKMRSAKARS